MRFRIPKQTNKQSLLKGVCRISRGRRPGDSWQLAPKLMEEVRGGDLGVICTEMGLKAGSKSVKASGSVESQRMLAHRHPH